MSNYIYRNENEEVLKRVRDEFIEYVGRDAKITGPGELTVYGLPQKAKKRGDEEEKRPQRVTKAERETGYIPRD